MTEVIKTKRLILRRFRREDSVRLVALMNDIEMARWLTMVPYPYKKEDTVEFIDTLAHDQDAFAVNLDDTLIGCVSTGSQPGYWIEKGSWGRGYVTEASQAMITRYFQTGQEALKSGYHLGNTRSKAVLNKLGFQPRGQHTATSRATGEGVTIQDMVLNRTDWEAAQ